MTKEEYLISLELALINAGVNDYEEIVEKYRKRFELASMADMTTDEAIKMMGSVESVVKKYVGEEKSEYFDVYTFKLEDAEYKVSFLTLPAGYTHAGSEENYYFDGDATELTITLKKAE